MATKNIVLYGSGTHHASTMQGGCYREVVLPWSAGRWHAISTNEPRTHGRKPSKATIRQFVQCGSLDYCECSFGVRSRMPHNHLRDNLPFVFIKAQTTTGPGGTQNPAAALGCEARLPRQPGLWRRSAEHRAPTANRGSRSTQPLTWADRIVCHAQARLLWQSSTVLSTVPLRQCSQRCHGTIIYRGHDAESRCL
ncbi:hypothetical protein HPB50_006956 [Hyalomma asiaticum]|uniref:Uncharacterized protein n=1 Tax=Hyalomma asiaticum TaxID=266040 RepID=A0ACB7TDF8_HYAAI|nr:hypothetical protein HPB50_006956 [Hyalomma asiaticum]